MSLNIQDGSSSATTDTRRRLEEKYRRERDKRLNAQGTHQYVAIEGRFARFAADPNAGVPVDREPSPDLVDVVIVGGGIAGLLTAVELRRAGLGDFRIIETGADFGGTWYWNRYPGIACDCESLIYMPLLEELGYVPTERYARGDEIRRHLCSVAKAFDLYDGAMFQTQVTEVRWSNDDRRWVVLTDRGDELKTKFIVLGSGPLNRPKLPGIPGIRDFKGHQFHSSRWDYGYTGGGPDGGMVNLCDKRVAVVGTGSSGVQIIPAVARDAEHLYVVQRTPSIIDSRDNAPVDPGWAKGLPAGWQRQRMDNFDAILAGVPQEHDAIADKWTTIWGGGAEAMATGSFETAMAFLADMDIAQMERIRARVDELVDDPRTAESLKPYYNRFCKRPCFSDYYLQTFNRPNVTLIDTDGNGLERITESGIVFGGVEYPVDCIVYATGFEFAVTATRSGGFEVYSPTGVSLSEHRAEGIRSLHGIYMSGFPNLFMIGALHHAAVSINQPLVFGDQGRHVAQLIKRFLEDEIEIVEVRPEAEQRWGEVIAAKSTYNSDASRNCTPGAFNNENTYEKGRPSVFATAYGGGPIEYLEVLKTWRAESVDEDLLLADRLSLTANGSGG
ncbi:MAG TPA: NAD(P)/FAD-dependent oxidoreductase [Solirubrobacteraceae bacterium]